MRRPLTALTLAALAGFAPLHRASPQAADQLRAGVAVPARVTHSMTAEPVSLPAVEAARRPVWPYVAVGAVVGAAAGVLVFKYSAEGSEANFAPHYAALGYALLGAGVGVVAGLVVASFATN